MLNTLAWIGKRWVAVQICTVRLKMMSSPRTRWSWRGGLSSAMKVFGGGAIICWWPR